jgi:uncharacterized cupredoxin-like copper-binding protein
MKGMSFWVAFAILLPAAAPAEPGAPAQVTITLRDFKMEPADIQLHVGEDVALTLRNEGRVAHEWLIGKGVVRTPQEKGFQIDLFALLGPTIEGRQYSLEQVGRRPPGRDERATRTSTGLLVQPGGEVKLRFTVPPTASGDWEVGCFFPGHYESGMKGTMAIR